MNIDFSTLPTARALSFGAVACVLQVTSNPVFLEPGNFLNVVGVRGAVRCGVCGAVRLGVRGAVRLGQCDSVAFCGVRRAVRLR